MKSKSTTLAAYSGAFLMIISLVAIGYRAPQTNSVANTAPATANLADSRGATSVDQLLAANVAANMAETVGLPVAGNLRESSTSLYIKSRLAQNDTEIISKPQIVQPEAGGRGIVTYTSKAGDTVQAIANHYGITAQTLRWSNNLTSDALDANKKLLVPQVDGVVYTAKSGDTIEKLASKYKADSERIVLYNDLEKKKLVKGMRIVIPGGVLPETERPGYREPTLFAPQPQVAGLYNTGLRSGGSYTSGKSTVLGYGTPMHGGNRYAFGNCTAYVYDKRYEAGKPIGGMWGNGRDWAISAMNAGYTVNGTPAVGSIMQSVSGGGGYGHVAYVEAVNSDGSIVLTEMNYAGFNTVSQRTLSAYEASQYNYIH